MLCFLALYNGVSIFKCRWLLEKHFRGIDIAYFAVYRLSNFANYTLLFATIWVKYLIYRAAKREHLIIHARELSHGGAPNFMIYLILLPYFPLKNAVHLAKYLLKLPPSIERRW